MKSLSFYVLRQIAGPAFLFSALMTTVIWLTQSLRLLDLVLNRGQSAAVFAYLTLLTLPSMLNAILPIAFFAGAVYALHRLNSDSELSVMWAAGFSRAQLATPVLMAGILVMALTYACGLYLMPLGQRVMKDKVFDIRADLGAAILQEGQFSTPVSGLTVFVRELDPSGHIHGILVQDSRNPRHIVTYLAESGLLAQTAAGPRLIMYNGNVEQTGQDGAQLSVLVFSQYVFDLDAYGAPQRTGREMTERYLPELLHPDPSQARLRGVFLAEAHNRLSSPLYCLAFAFIALAATAKGHMGRRGYGWRMAAASVLAATIRMLGYATQGGAAKHAFLLPLLYLLPLAATAIAAAIFFETGLGARLTGVLRPRLRQAPAQ